MNVLVIGGRGFVGQAVCQALKRHTVYTYDPKPGGDYHKMGSVLDVSSLIDAVENMDVVINLAGLSPLKTPKRFSYEQIHVNGVRNIISACKEHKIKRLIHMSALGADGQSSISYLKTKGYAEQMIKDSKLPAIIFAPSLIYDTQNELITMMQRFAPLRFFPTIPAKMQPVYRQDIAKFFLKAVQGKVTHKRLEIGGPDVLTVSDMAKLVFEKEGYSFYYIPFRLVKLGASFAASLSLFGLGEDQLQSFELDNITRSRLTSKYVKLTKFSSWVKKEL